ncbi:MAG: arsenite efflux transporter metallochaperone ArsD [Loktanella sp.]|nr:arsenite efflux transporter metallochaperone ArsD [Loktanella sp.]
MTIFTVYDPAMCCSTGICGSEVDQRLVDLAADLDWLKAQGVTVQRFGLSREPTKFVANNTIRQIMQDSEGDDLPVFMVGEVLKAKGRYPSRAELAEWTNITTEKVVIPTQETKLAPAKATRCCSTKAASARETAGSCC